MTQFNITTFNGSIQNQSVQLINARELHEFLQIQTPFHKWISRRISDYNFAENLDFIERTILSARGFFKTEVKDYHITLDMAKELCMLERSEIGRQARRHFIKMERHAIELAHKMQEQMLAIPTFLRNNPSEIVKLKRQAQQALFTAYPECEKIILYRDMGLENHEIGKLLDLSKKALELRLRKLFDLGLLQRRQAVRQLALFA